MFDALGIVCHDIKESIKFYEFFGLQFQQVGGPDHYECTTKSGVRIMLDSESLIKKLNPQWQRPATSGVICGFKMTDSEKVNDLYQKIINQGYVSVSAPWDAFWGQRYASVQDPNGFQVDFFADK